MFQRVPNTSPILRAKEYVADIWYRYFAGIDTSISNNTNEIVNIKSNTDKIFPISYGEAFFPDTANMELTAQDTWYKVANFTPGHLDNVNFNANSNFEVKETATYRVDAAISFGRTSAGGSQRVHWTYGVNDVPDEDHQIIRDVSTTTQGALAIWGIEPSVAADSNISLFCLNNTSAGLDITMEHITFGVHKIHTE